LLLAISAITFTIDLLDQIILNHHYSALIGLIFIPAWIKWCWKLCDKVEDAVNNTSSPLVTFSMTAHEWFILRLRRLLLFIFGCMFIGTRFDFWYLAAILCSGAMYFLSDFHPSSKSWVRQKFSNMANVIKQIKIPSIQPIPPPIPS
jgi:hypothetical protein